ncbi:MAG: hypothetical protein JWQ87_5586 [Candidatus Sulfotelmatobacter sp.]|nr:hypothetical protein [Candidatus Sulfotelmatobacter sp.]
MRLPGINYGRLGQELGERLQKSLLFLAVFRQTHSPTLTGGGKQRFVRHDVILLSLCSLCNGGR